MSGLRVDPQGLFDEIKALIEREARNDLIGQIGEIRLTSTSTDEFAQRVLKLLEL